MNPTSLTWLGLAIGAGSPYNLRSLQGWEERPAARYDKQVRARGHGTHPSQVWSDERIVTVEGWCFDGEQRDRLLADFQAAAAYRDGDHGDPLTVTAAGRTLTADAQLLEARPVLARGQWGVGWFGWLLQWRCPDPLRYGPWRSASTGLPTSGGGLAWPLFADGFLDWGPSGNPGQVTLTNQGSADAAIAVDVIVGEQQGWELSAAGQRLTYPVAVAGQTITVDTADGTVLAEGTADRRSELTHADWMLVPARSSLTVQFTSLGAAPDPGARLTARWREAHW